MRSPRTVAVVAAVVVFVAVALDAIAAVFDDQVGSLSLLVVGSIIAGSLLLLSVGILLLDNMRRQTETGFALLNERLDMLSAEFGAKLQDEKEQAYATGLIEGIRGRRDQGGTVSELVRRSPR
jgi:hypothetical protein